MMKKIIFFLAFGFTLLPIQRTNSCGYSDNYFYGYSFFNKAIVDNQTNSARFFVEIISFDDLYNADNERDSIFKRACDDENLWEWRQKFCDYADLEDVREVIYQSSIEQLVELRTATQNNDMIENIALKNNEFAQQIAENNCAEVVDYLLFAKKCEPHVVATDAWEGEKKDIVTMAALVEDGKKLFLATKSPFLRLRYAFQVMRLAHYAGHYQTTVNLYNYLLPKVDGRVKSVVHYWVLSLKAGALKRLNQRVEASYLFSVVFENCLSKRLAAMKGFAIQSDYEWQQCLSLCRNDKEKVSLYAMRAAHDEAKAVEEMQLIYDLDAQNPHLENLLLGEIRKLERDLLGYSFNDKKIHNQRFANLPRAAAGEYAIRLHQFVLKCIKEKKVKRPEIWRVADGYLELLRGDFYAATRTLDKAKDFAKTPALKEQIEVLILAAEISAFDKLDVETEDKVAAIVENPLYKKYKDLPDFLFDKLGQFYEKNNRKGMAYRCHHRIEAMKPNPQIDIIDDLLLLCQKTGKNSIERLFTTDEKGNSIEDELWEMKGVYLLSQHQNEAALEAFKKVSIAQMGKQKFNPFGMRIKDCIYCPAKDSSKFLDRQAITEKLIDLEYQSKSDLETGYKSMLKLGVAYYNMSYYGHSWGVMDYYRTGTAWHTAENRYDDDYAAYAYPFGNREQTDVRLAYQYLTNAYDLAKGKDPETAVKCAFWAAKCQQKLYYTSSDFRQTAYGKKPNFPPEYLTFSTLFKQYSDTQYFQEVIKECSYLR
jgi:hypothetical protein